MNTIKYFKWILFAGIVCLYNNVNAKGLYIVKVNANGKTLSKKIVID